MLAPNHRPDPWLTLTRDRSWAGRLTAIGEPLCLLLGGIILARLVFRGIGGLDADRFLFPEDGAVDFMAAARAEGLWHLVRYGLLISLFVVVSALRGRRGRQTFAVTAGPDGWARNTAVGLVLGAFMSLPTLLLMLADRYVDLGPGTPFWALMAEVEWDAAFWAFMAVSSFAVVPLVEELVARGYMLGRFRESFSPGAALILMAVVFALAHGQYHQANVLAIGHLVSLILGSVSMGYAVYRTGSLIPPVVAHAFVNIPLSASASGIVVAGSVVLLVTLRRAVSDWIRGAWATLVSIDDLGPLVVIVSGVAVSLLTLRATAWSPYLWLATYLFIFTISLVRRSSWWTQGRPAFSDPDPRRRSRQ